MKKWIEEIKKLIDPHKDDPRLSEYCDLIEEIQHLESRLEAAERVCKVFQQCAEHPGKQKAMKELEEYHWRVNHLHVLVDKSKWEAGKEALTEWEKRRE